MVIINQAHVTMITAVRIMIQLEGMIRQMFYSRYVGSFTKM